MLPAFFSGAQAAAPKCAPKAKTCTTPGSELDSVSELAARVLEGLRLELAGTLRRDLEQLLREQERRLLAALAPRQHAPVCEFTPASCAPSAQPLGPCSYTPKAKPHGCVSIPAQRLQPTAYISEPQALTPGSCANSPGRRLNPAGYLSVPPPRLNPATPVGAPLALPISTAHSIRMTRRSCSGPTSADTLAGLDCGGASPASAKGGNPLAAVQEAQEDPQDVQHAPASAQAALRAGGGTAPSEGSGGGLTASTADVPGSGRWSLCSVTDDDLVIVKAASDGQVPYCSAGTTRKQELVSYEAFLDVLTGTGTAAPPRQLLPEESHVSDDDFSEMSVSDASLQQPLSDRIISSTSIHEEATGNLDAGSFAEMRLPTFGVTGGADLGDLMRAIPEDKHATGGLDPAGCLRKHLPQQLVPLPPREGHEAQRSSRRRSTPNALGKGGCGQHL